MKAEVPSCIINHMQEHSHVSGHHCLVLICFLLHPYKDLCTVIKDEKGDRALPRIEDLQTFMNRQLVANFQAT